MTAPTFHTLRKRIVQAGSVMAASSDFRPANDGFHSARYELFSIAAADHDRAMIERLSADEELQDLARTVFEISCRAGVEEECAKARELLSRQELTFQQIYQGYFGAVYETLMRDEIAWYEHQSGKSLAGQDIAYIGGGAMPVPAMLMAKLLGCKVTVFDPDATSCELAGQLIARVGLGHLIDVVNKPAQEGDYRRYGLAWIANWIEHKRPIFARLHQYPNVRYVVARSAADNSLGFLINDPLDCRSTCEGYRVRHRTERRKGLSLVSIVLENLSCSLATQPARTKAPVVDSMTDLIGNTPMLRLDPAKTGLKNIELFAKLEHLNPFGSIKDRTALGMIGPHIDEIAADGKTIIELSSGNAARGLQAIASMRGVNVETLSNRIRVSEMRKMLLIQGAKITPLPQVDPHDAYAALNFVDERARTEERTSFYTDQYRNPANAGAHRLETGREIVEQIGPVDFFVGAIGTAGSTIGISDCLRQSSPGLDVTGVVSDKDDFIPGIRHKDEIFDVGPFAEDSYNRITAVSARQAIDGMLSLVRDFGVMAGPSSGAALYAALDHLRSVDAALSTRKTAVLVVCDRIELYLSYIEERRPDLFA